MGFYFQNPTVAFLNVTEHDYIIVIVSHLLDIYLHTESRLVFFLTYIFPTLMSFQSRMIFCHKFGMTWEMPNYYCASLLKSCHNFVWGIERNWICMLMQSQSFIRWSITNLTGTASTWDSGWKEAQWSQRRSLRGRLAQVESCMLIWPYWLTVLCHPVCISVILHNLPVCLPVNRRHFKHFGFRLRQWGCGSWRWSGPWRDRQCSGHRSVHMSTFYQSSLSKHAGTVPVIVSLCSAKQESE